MTAAFVLTGGGSLGAVQVGMLTALHESGIEPDLLVGTSVGALNAAYLAGPGSSAARVEGLTKLWTRLRRRDVFVPQPQRWVLAALGSVPSLFAAAPLQALLERNLGYEAFEDARVPVHVTATDLVTGHGLLLATGPVVSAVMASASVPGLLPPVERQGRTLVDGAVGRADALTHAAESGVDDIYLLPAGYACAGPAPSTALASALTALSLVLHRQLLDQVAAYHGTARLHVLPPLCPLAVSAADFSHSRSLVDLSHRSTLRWLDERRGRADDDPGVLSLHEHRPARQEVRS